MCVPVASMGGHLISMPGVGIVNVSVGNTHTHTHTNTHRSRQKHFDRRVHRQKMLTSFYRSILMPGVLAVNVAVCAMNAFCL